MALGVKDKFIMNIENITIDSKYGNVITENIIYVINGNKDEKED